MEAGGGRRWGEVFAKMLETQDVSCLGEICEGWPVPVLSVIVF